MKWFKFSREKYEPKIISYEEVIEMMKGKHCLVDSRGRSSYGRFHLPGAINIPDEEFGELCHLLPEGSDTPIIFYCKNIHCVLSPNSARKAITLGYKNIYIFKGGVAEWCEKTGTVINEEKELGRLDKKSFLDFYKNKKDQIYLIDVNDKFIYDRGHLKGALNLPYGYILVNYRNLPKDKPIIFYCSSGSRSEDIYYFLKTTELFEEGRFYYLSCSVIFEDGKAKIV
ncbi:MAG: rhodanese-like domain-containing protein [Deferribacterales bacterium]